MAADWVLDTSVLAKCLFSEPDSDSARAAVARAGRLIAPDYLFIELSSIAAKKIRREEVTHAYAAEAIRRAQPMLDEVVAARPFAAKALELAVEHGVSVYDGLYVAVAMARDGVVLTADIRLVEACKRAGLGRYALRLDAAG
jgi:predicted nucleic acid-binding protein